MSHGIWRRVKFYFLSLFDYVVRLILLDIFCADLLPWVIRARIFGVDTSPARSCAKLKKAHHLKALPADKIR